jgi:voltage-gated potassium channel
MIYWLQLRFLRDIRRWFTGALRNPLRRLQVAVLALALLLAYGTIGYMAITGASALDSFYMTLFTITTVGYGEIVPISPEGRLFTISVIIFGIGIASAAIGEGLRVALEPVLWESLQGRRMEKLLAELRNHYIVCGFGRIGHQVVQDLQARDVAFVIIDANTELEAELRNLKLPYVIGDATLEATLKRASIEHARGLVTELSGDADNILTVLTARLLNPKLYIIARAAHSETEQKLRMVGANQVINPYKIGGHRIALSLMRPVVNEALHRILHFDEDPHVDIGQITLTQGQPIVGQTLQQCDLRQRYQVNILAIKRTDGHMSLNPQGETVLRAGDTLVIIGASEQVYALERQYGEDGPNTR